jgi:hypothetical protein
MSLSKEAKSCLRSNAVAHDVGGDALPIAQSLVNLAVFLIATSDPLTVVLH